jgi:hypothetical protein
VSGRRCLLWPDPATGIAPWPEAAVPAPKDKFALYWTLAVLAVLIGLIYAAYTQGWLGR